MKICSLIIRFLGTSQPQEAVQLNQNLREKTLFELYLRPTADTELVMEDGGLRQGSSKRQLSSDNLTIK